MHFAVTALDFPDGLERRLAVRPRHLELIERLQKEGRCLYAARLIRDDGSGNSNGSLMIFDYPSREELDEMLAQEPYVNERVWETIEVRLCEVAPRFLTA